MASGIRALFDVVGWYGHEPEGKRCQSTREEVRCAGTYLFMSICSHHIVDGIQLPYLVLGPF